MCVCWVLTWGERVLHVNLAKEKNKVDHLLVVFDVFVGLSMTDHDFSDEESLDEDFGIPKVKNLEVCKSTCVKYPVERLKYDTFVPHHFMYM